MVKSGLSATMMHTLEGSKLGIHTIYVAALINPNLLFQSVVVSLAR